MTETKGDFNNGPGTVINSGDEKISEAEDDFDGERYEAMGHASEEDLSQWYKEHPEDSPDYVDVAEIVSELETDEESQAQVSDDSKKRQRPQVEGQISFADLIEKRDLDIASNPYAVDLSERHKALKGLMESFNIVSRYSGINKYAETRQGYNELLERYGSHTKVREVLDGMKQDYLRAKNLANQCLDVLVGDESAAKLVAPDFDRKALKRALAGDLYERYGYGNGTPKSRQDLVKKTEYPRVSASKK